MNMTAFLLLAIFADPVTAQADTGASEQPKAERKICRRDYASESRMGSKRICKTAAEWKAEQGTAPSNGALERARRGN